MIKILEEDLREFICGKIGKFSDDIEFHLSNFPKILFKSDKDKEGEIVISYGDLKFTLEGGYVNADTGDNVIFLIVTLTYFDKESERRGRIIFRCKYLLYDTDGIVYWDSDGLDIKTAIISILSALQMSDMQIIECPIEI
jgi:hypothetical protein